MHQERAIALVDDLVAAEPGAEQELLEDVVRMPSHGKWVDGNRAPCAGGVGMPGKQEIVTRVAARSATILGGGFIAVVLVPFALLLSIRCADDDSDAVGQNDYSGSGVPAVGAPTVPVEDTSIADYLRAAGVGDELVRQLWQVAGETGYWPTRGRPSSSRMPGPSPS